MYCLSSFHTHGGYVESNNRQYFAYLSFKQFLPLEQLTIICNANNINFCLFQENVRYIIILDQPNMHGYNYRLIRKH